MSSIKNLLPVLLAFLLLNFSSSAQTQNLSDPVLAAKAQQYASEVFKDYPQYADQAYLPVYMQQLSQVKIKEETIQANESYVLLSSFELKNKYNTGLQRDNAANFNPDSFNALKYFFNFYANTVQKIRVDNSNFLIIIQPKL